MSRYLQAGDGAAYSDVKPERFVRDRYVEPEAVEPGEVRKVDDIPGLEELKDGPAVYARRGYGSLKGQK